MVKKKLLIKLFKLTKVSLLIIGRFKRLKLFQIELLNEMAFLPTQSESKCTQLDKRT